MKNTDRGFIFFYDWGPAFEQMSAENVKKLLLAIVDFARDGIEPPTFTGEASLAAHFIFPALERRQYYKEQGKLGGLTKAKNRINKTENNLDAASTDKNNSEETSTLLVPPLPNSSTPLVPPLPNSSTPLEEKVYHKDKDIDKNKDKYKYKYKDIDIDIDIYKDIDQDPEPPMSPLEGGGPGGTGVFNKVGNFLAKNTESPCSPSRDYGMSFGEFHPNETSQGSKACLQKQPLHDAVRSQRDDGERSRESIFDMTEEEREVFFNQRRREINRALDEYLSSSKR